MFDFNINGGTGIVFIQGTTDDINYIGDANNFSLANLTRTLFNGNREIYGNFTVPATGGTINGGTNFTNIRGFSGTYTIATANRALDFPMTFNGNGNYIISENLVVGVNTVSSTRTLTLTAGNMSISNGVGVHSANFFSSSTSPRNINFAGTNSRLKLLANNTTLWNSNIGTNFSYSGTPYIESIYTATAAATRTMDFGSIPEAFTFDIVVPINTPGFAINTANDFCNITGNVRDFNISAYTGTVTNATRNIHGNLTIPASNGTYATGTAVTSFTATSGTRTIDTANRTLQFPFTFNGPGGTFVLNSNIVANTTTVLTLANGTVDFRQRDANTWANITIAGGATGNVAIQNLVSNRNFVHNSGCLITQSGAVNSSTTGTYTMNNANCTLNVSASFSTAAFTHTAGNIIL
jgi:hypothetical protein